MDFEKYRKITEAIDLRDYSSLLNMGRKWKKIQTNRNFNVRMGIIGSASIQLITSVTKALLTKYDIYADVYEGEYNGILMDVLDEKSKLYEFKPDYIVIIPDYRDILDMKPNILASNEQVDVLVRKVIDNYLNIFNSIHNRLPGAQILISNFVEPYFGSLGNLEINYIFSQRMYFKQINMELVRFRPSYVSILDMESLAEYIGKKEWFNESAYFLNKSGFSLTYIGYCCDLIARQFEAFSGKPRKCLVLDLDNTLWGGAVGDLGYEGIMLDPNDAEGEAFQSFQKYLLELKRRGVILAVCSKNDEKNAKEPFERNAHMILHMSDFSSFIANWMDKAANIKTIAKDLNIGVDSIVFFDDNPTERELVRVFLPEVKVIDVPDDPALYVRALDQAFAFEWNQITKEDINRNQSYADNIERNNLLESCVDYESYLKKLHMHIKFKPIEENTLERFAQLINKTNQFNLRTVRYSEAEIVKMMSDSSYKLMTVSLSDKFSNYGIIACVVLKFNQNICFIENWIMSCRVLKKTVENYTIQKIVELAVKEGCNQIKSEYLQSKKNSIVGYLFEELGFELEYSSEKQKRYVLNGNKLKTYIQKYYFEED